MSTTRETIHPTIRTRIYDEEPDCHYCGHREVVGEIDHVIPVTQGGLSHRQNLVNACERCNAQKSGKNPQEWRAWRSERGYCWPPQDRNSETTARYHGPTDRPRSGSALLQHAALTDTPLAEHLGDYIDGQAKRIHNGDQPDPVTEGALLNGAVIADAIDLLGPVALYLTDEALAGRIAERLGTPSYSLDELIGLARSA